MEWVGVDGSGWEWMGVDGVDGVDRSGWESGHWEEGCSSLLGRKGAAPGRKGVPACFGGKVLGGGRVLQLACGELGRKGVVEA